MVHKHFFCFTRLIKGVKLSFPLNSLYLDFLTKVQQEEKSLFLWLGEGEVRGFYALTLVIVTPIGIPKLEFLDELIIYKFR